MPTEYTMMGICAQCGITRNSDHMHRISGSYLGDATGGKSKWVCNYPFIWIAETPEQFAERIAQFEQKHTGAKKNV